MANTIEFSGASPITKDTYILGLNTQPPYSAKSKASEIAHIIGDGVFVEKGDTYTKSEADGVFANKEDTYTKEEVDGGFASKEDTYTKAEVDEKIAEGGGGSQGDTTPIGTVIAFTGAVIPTGWFTCDGSAYLKTDYQKLYEVIGDKYRLDTDTDDTKFRVPDYRGKFLEGSDIVGTHKEAGLPNITGSTDVTYAVVRGSQTGALKDSTFSGGTRSSSPSYSTSDTYGKLDFKASNSNEIYGNSETVQPESYTVRYIIRAFDAVSETTESDIETELDELRRQIATARIPIGTVQPYMGNNTPSGWLLCNGDSHLTSEYPALAEVLGQGDSERFTVPNLLGRFLEGSEVAGTAKEAGLPDITGRLDSVLLMQENNGTGAFNKITRSGYTNTRSGDNLAFKHVSFKASVGETNTDGNLKTNDADKVYGKSNTVQPPSVTVRYIIKAYDEVTEASALSDVMTAFNDLSEKVESRRHIIENTVERNGSYMKGYELYSDGWFIQYGYGDYISTGGTQNVLWLPYDDNSYYVMLMPSHGSYGTNGYGINGRSINSFTVCANTSGSRSYMWITYGWAKNLL